MDLTSTFGSNACSESSPAQDQKYTVEKRSVRLQPLAQTTSDLRLRRDAPSV